MTLDVGLHFLLVLESLVADGALVALGAVMLDTVQLQHMIVAKVTEADVAVVGLLARVGARVDLQLFGAGESLAAARLRALVGLLAGVRAHVDDQLARLDERLLADGALVWSFAGVDAHMAMEFSGVLEGTTAHIALVGTLLGVNASVDLQVLLDAEELVTKFALEGSLAGMGAVVTDLEWMRKIRITMIRQFYP